MAKFFAFVGYIVSVLAAAFGIVYFVNKLTDRAVDEEIEAELDDVSEDDIAEEIVVDATAEAAE